MKPAYAWYVVLLINTWKAYGAKDCCMEVETMCKFLCKDPLSGSFIDNVACAAERIKLLRCNVNGGSLANIIDGLSDSLEQKWYNISENLRILISDKKHFGDISIKELEDLQQELLSHLKTLSGMTSEQFSGIMYRLKDFKLDNLESFFDKVDTSIIFANITELGVMSWNKLQLKIVSETAYKEFGEKIESWTSTQLKNLGNLLAGIPSIKLAEISPKAFNESLQDLCNVKLSFQQKLTMLNPAIKVFGNVMGWDETTIKRMCQFLVGLTAQNFKYIKPSEIIGSIDALQKYIVQKEIRDVILKKVKESWGDISQWSTQQIANIGTLVNDIDVSDIQKLNRDQLEQFLGEVDVKILDKVQLAALFEKIPATFQDNWPDEILNKGGALLQSIKVLDLDDIHKNSIVPFLKRTKDADWTQEQAEILFNKVSDLGLSTLSKDDVVNLNSIVKAFLSSDVAKLSRKAIFTGMHELAFTSGIAGPVIRHFIRVYREENKNGNIKTLGQFAEALTRYDLEKETIDDILGNLDALKYIFFDKAQNLELLKKVLIKFRELRQKDNEQENGLDQVFKNINKIGNVSHALSRQQLLTYPAHALESVIEILGESDMWGRRQVLAVIEQLKTYWEEHKKTISDLNEFDVETLGKFVQGFTIKELDKIPNDVQKVVWQKLGEFTGLAEDKLQSRAMIAYENLKKMNGGVFNSTSVKIMGNLLAGLSADTIKEIDPDVVVSNLYAFVNIKEMPLENLRVIVDIVKNATGTDLQEWKVDQWRKLRGALKTLNVDELNSINNESFKLLIDLFGSFDNLTDSQINATMAKIKEVFGDVPKWSVEVFKKIGGFINTLRHNDIEKINTAILKNVIDYLGHAKNQSIKFQEALAKRFIEVILNNDISNLNITMIKRMGTILEGFDVNDLKKINISTIDILAELGNRENWSAAQLEVLINSAKEFMTSSSDSEKYLYIQNIARGLSVGDINAIPGESFKIAAGMFGKIIGFTAEQRQAFAAKAKEAWGNDVTKWTAAMISEAGQFIDGLLNYDITKISPVNVASIPSNVIARMETSKIQAFTEYQFLEFTQDQARAVTKQHLASLSPASVMAIKSVIDEDPEELPKDVSKMVESKRSRGVMLQSAYMLTVFVVFTWFLFVLK